jgi:hypothetical protein
MPDDPASQEKPVKQHDIEAELRASRELLAEMDTLLQRSRTMMARPRPRIRIAVLKDPPVDPA